MPKIVRIGVVLLALIGLLCRANAVQAALKATSVVYAWDINTSKFENGNVVINYDGGWVPFVHELNFDNEDYTYTMADGNPCTTTLAGEMEYAFYYEDTDGKEGFQESRNWSLVACDRDGDGDFDNADLSLPLSVPFTVYNDGPGGEEDHGYFSIASTDVVTPCTTGNCAFEKVTTMVLSIDENDADGDPDCDYNPNLDIPAGGLCFYAEARTPLTGADAPIWNPGLQARISAGGGDKTVNFKPQPTAVTLSSFKAYENLGQVVIEWKTTSESGTVGFLLYRMDELTGEYQQINDQLLPGLLTSHQGGTYRYVDQQALFGETYTYKLVEIEAKGKERVYGPFTVTVGEEGIDHPRITASYYSRRPNEIPAAQKARNRAAKAARRKAESLREVRSSGDVVKIGVTAKGLYYLDASEMANLLATPLQRVKNMIKTTRFSLSNRGQEVAYFPAEGNAGIYFYAEGLESIYSRENIFWLSLDSGLKMELVDGGGPPPASGGETFTDVLQFEEDRFATTGLFHDPQADYWLWDYVVSGYPDLNSKSFNFSAESASATGTGTLTVRLKGATNPPTDPDHHVVVRLNGSQIGEGYWDGTNAYELVLPFSQVLLRDGHNALNLTGVLDTGAPYSIFYLDSFDVSYQRHYRATDNSLLARGDGNPVMTITGFTDPLIKVFDVTDPAAPKLVASTTLDGDNTGYRVSFRPASPESLYLALTTDGLSEPEFICTDMPSNLRKKSNGAAYVVITPLELSVEARSLADYREGQGLETMVVQLEDIYDEFNAGIASPEAIRDFLSYAYHHWRMPPKYVVLAGEGTYDYKDNQGYSDNLVPPILVDTPNGLFVSDNRFVDVEGDDGVPEMAIGRLPAATREELRAVIDKIMIYESTRGASWKGNVLMVADDPDDGGDFPADSDDVAAKVPPEYAVQKIYLSDLTTKEARERLLAGINGGALLLNYIGHGGLDRLAGEGLLLTEDVDSLTNGEKLPLVTAMTCVVGQFSIPGLDSLSETMVLKNDNGAIAVWAPSGLSYNSEAKILDEGFFRAYFEYGENILGEIVLMALEDYAITSTYPYLMDIYILLGDPAIKIQ